MKNKYINSAVFCSMLMMSFSVAAQQSYISLDVGKSEIDLGVSGIDDSDTSISVSGGVKINDNFALEIGYIDFGEITISGRGSATIGADAIEFSAIALVPLSAQVGLMGRFGIDLWDADLEYNNVPSFGSGKETDDGNDIFFGVGAFANVGDKVSLQLEYQLHELDDVDIDVLSLGLSFFF